MENKPVGRLESLRKIQRNIDVTIYDMETADEMIAETKDEGIKKYLIEKNEGRKRSLDAMRREIVYEAQAQERGEH